MKTDEKKKVVKAFEKALDEIDNKDSEKKTKTTLVAFLLDETQSMQVCKDKTISAFNEYVNTLKDKDDFSFCLTRFNSSKVDIGEIVSIKEAVELTKKNYNPNHSTPLFDAIGKTITKIETDADKDAAILFVILTDGEENSSIEFNKEKIAKLIEQKTKDKWTFVYLGANQDAWAAANLMGIATANAMNFSNTNIKGAMHTLGAASARYCASGSTHTSSFFNPNEQDNR